MPPEVYRKQFDRFVEMLDMAEFLDRPVRQLSLGQRMRGDLAADPLPGRADDRARRRREGHHAGLHRRGEPRARHHRGADHPRHRRRRAALLPRHPDRPRAGALRRDPHRAQAAVRAASHARRPGGGRRRADRPDQRGRRRGVRCRDRARRRRGPGPGAAAVRGWPDGGVGPDRGARRAVLDRRRVDRRAGPRGRRAADLLAAGVAGMTAVAMTTDLPPLAARPWWRQWGALRHVARLRTAAMFAYRNTMLLFLGVSIVQIFMLKKVWGALYAARPGVLSIPLADLIVYLTIANLIVWSFPTHTVSRYLRERIREGSVVSDLVRPVGFVPQLVAQLAGALGGALLIIVIALPAVALAGSLSLPAGAGAAGMFAVSLLCAYGIAGLLSMMLSMVAFWTLEIDGLTMLYVLC